MFNFVMAGLLTSPGTGLLEEDVFFNGFKIRCRYG